MSNEKENKNHHPTWKGNLYIAACSAFITAMLMGIGVYEYQQVDVQRHIREVNAFEADPIWGFERLREVGLSVGQAVVLPPAGMTYDSTYNPFSSQTSPAMSLQLPALCEVSLSPRGLRAIAGPLEVNLNAEAGFGILVHEIGHCVDISRDVGIQAGSNGHSNSIAPGDRAKATSPQTMYETAFSHSTVLWREAYADLFAIGYWKLSKAKADANALTNWLLDLRLKRAAQDPDHATMCWIREATNANAPMNIKELPEWVDRLRNLSQCSLEAKDRKAEK